MEHRLGYAGIHLLVNGYRMQHSNPPVGPTCVYKIVKRLNPKIDEVGKKQGSMDPALAWAIARTIGLWSCSYILAKLTILHTTTQYQHTSRTYLNCTSSKFHSGTRCTKSRLLIWLEAGHTGSHVMLKGNMIMTD